jgi:hypothetical protein
LTFTAILAANTHNFVRAESLRPLSLEAVALVIGVIMAWRRRSGGLLACYSIALPFNDVVYRLGPMTPSDIIGIALIVTQHRRRDDLTRPLMYWLIWGVVVTFAVGAPFFSIAYTVRFVVILLVAAAAPGTRAEGRVCVEALSAVTILAASIAALQVVLWRVGFPIDGVFAAGGFIRPKSLSHEPSTASMWFALALPLLTVPPWAMTRRRRLHLAIAIAIGLATTASLSGLTVVAVLLAVLVVRYLRQWRQRTMYFAAGVLVIVIAVVAGGTVYRDQISEMAGKVVTFGNEYAKGSRPVSIDDVSGREGDLTLVEYFPPDWVMGHGMFSSPGLAQALEAETGVYAPASNVLVTTAIETGLIGLILFVYGMFVITLTVIRRHARDLPAFVAGFLGFEFALIGQRFLAFPQPWFMLGVARAMSAEPPSIETPTEPPTVVSDGRGPLIKERE